MRALKRRDYPLRFGKQLEPFERLGIGDRDVLRTSRVLEPRMLRADTRIIKPGGLDAYHPHVGVLDKRIEKSDGVRAAIHARDQYVGQAAFLYRNLAARLASDN